MSTQLNDSTRKTLTKNVNRQMTVYSLAAAAAGVSMMALAAPAEGKIVATKTNLPFNYLNSVSLDLNNDGIADFRFSIDLYLDFSFRSLANVTPLAGGEVEGHGVYASALMRTAKIGPSAHFTPGFNSHGGVTLELIRGSGRGSTHVYGKWRDNGSYHFLGVKFLINGTTHYGWVRLALSQNPTTPFSGTITAYAYETIPNKPILAGSSAKLAVEGQNVQESTTPSLGMLALGADGLPLWRNQDSLRR